MAVTPTATVSTGWKVMWLSVAAIIAASIPISFLVLASRIDTKDEATRCAVVALVDQLASNSERNTKAVIASPSSSEQQKRVAAVNLERIKRAKETTRDALDHPVGPRCPDV